MQKKIMKNLGISMIVENSKFKFEIDNKEVVLTSLYNKISQDEYIKEPFDIPLFYLNGFQGEEWQKLLPKAISATQDTLRVKFGDKEIYGDIIFIEKNQRLTIKLEIDNREDFRVCETVGPNIYGLVLGSDYTKNVFIYPHHAGEKTINPMDRYRKEDIQNFFRAYTRPTDYKTYIRQINYCGLASMSFMYLYDERSGLYFGSHDLGFPVTTLTAEVGSEKRFMGLSFTKHFDFNNSRYASGEYVLEINQSDWHEAKRIYREYISSSLKYHNYPDYLDNQSALNQCYNFKRQGSLPDNYFKNIPEMYEKGLSVGIDHMFIASWNRGGFDTDYPEYYPDMELGSAMDFVRGIKYIKERGGIATLYINARIFDIEGDYASTVGEKMAIKNRNQVNYQETYGIKTFTISCPSDKEWKNRLLDTAEFLVRGYGIMGVYLDQLASAEPFACYAKGHTHEHIGDFNNGYVEVLDRLHNIIQSYDKKTFILTENIGDLYCSYTFANLTWNGPDYDEFYNLIKYIFPEYVQINMVNPNGSKPKEQLDYPKFYSRMERAILLGSILWYGATTKRE
ncbi:MAG: DUF6259 domain-containing protein, partial [Clostridia bacterium]